MHVKRHFCDSCPALWVFILLFSRVLSEFEKELCLAGETFQGCLEVALIGIKLQKVLSLAHDVLSTFCT